MTIVYRNNNNYIDVFINNTFVFDPDKLLLLFLNFIYIKNIMNNILPHIKNIVVYFLKSQKLNI